MGKKNKKIVNQPISYTCELKFDGISINLLYENGNLIKALLEVMELQMM